MEKKSIETSRKWYNFETSFLTFRDEMRAFLHENGIKYELSDASVPGRRIYHFEIYASEKEAEKINFFIDSVSFSEV